MSQIILASASPRRNRNFLFPIKLIYWDLPNRQTTILRGKAGEYIGEKNK